MWTSFLKKMCQQDFSKIAQSGLTDCLAEKFGKLI